MEFCLSVIQGRLAPFSLYRNIFCIEYFPGALSFAWSAGNCVVFTRECSRKLVVSYDFLQKLEKRFAQKRRERELFVTITEESRAKKSSQKRPPQYTTVRLQRHSWRSHFVSSHSSRSIARSPLQQRSPLHLVQKAVGLT